MNQAHTNQDAAKANTVGHVLSTKEHITHGFALIAIVLYLIAAGCFVLRCIVLPVLAWLRHFLG